MKNITSGACWQRSKWTLRGEKLIGQELRELAKAAANGWRGQLRRAGCWTHTFADRIANTTAIALLRKLVSTVGTGFPAIPHRFPVKQIRWLAEICWMKSFFLLVGDCQHIINVLCVAKVLAANMLFSRAKWLGWSGWGIPDIFVIQRDFIGSCSWFNCTVALAWVAGLCVAVVCVLAAMARWIQFNRFLNAILGDWNI